MAGKKNDGRREKGTGSLYHDVKRKRWFLKVRVNGKPKSHVLRNEDGTACSTAVDAEKAARGLREILFADTKEVIATHIAVAKKLKRRSGLRLCDAWDTFQKQPDRPDSGSTTLAKYQSYFRIFHKWLQVQYPEADHVASIDADIAKDFLTYLWGTGVAARTYNAYVQALRMIFKHLAGPAALDSNPFDGIPHKTLETVSRHEFTAEQVEAIFAGFKIGFFYETEMEKLTTGRKRERVKVRNQYKPLNSAEMEVLLNLCCWTGCRGQDGCLMEWRNVDLGKNVISFIPRKTARKTGHRAVTIPLHPNLKTALTAAAGWRDQNDEGEDFILPHVAHRYKSNPSGVQKDVMKIIRCATGLETTAAENESFGRRKLAANAYSLHSFRHTFVSFCANSGVPLAVVAEIVGHGNPAMTRHYSHITTAAKQDAINVLPTLTVDAEAVPAESADDVLEVKRRKLLAAIAGADAEALNALLKRLEH